MIITYNFGFILAANYPPKGITKMLVMKINGKRS